MEFVVIDTETTGSSPQKGAELIEIAGVVVRNWEIVYEESFNELIKPKRHVPIFITMLTGINNLMLEDKPSVEIVLPRFYDFVGDRVLVIQNAPFDLSFLDYFGKKIGIGELPNPFVDTISLSRSLFRGRHNLDIILARLGIFCEDRHRALGDAIATAKAFIKMAKMIGIEEIERFVVRRI